MAYLFVLNGAARHRAFPLADGAWVIGKAEAADIRIPDTWVSGRHARIVIQGTRLTLEDLDSTNGTYVNFERVDRAELADEDVVFLGGTHVYVSTTSRLPSPPPRPLPHAPAPLSEDVLRARMQRRPDELDLSPLDEQGSDAPSIDLHLDSAVSAASAAATLFLDPSLLDSLDLDALDDEDDEATETDAFRAPPPTAQQLAELERVLLTPRLHRPIDPDAKRELGAAPFQDDSFAGSDTGRLQPITGSVELDLEDLLRPPPFDRGASADSGDARSPRERATEPQRVTYGEPGPDARALDRDPDPLAARDREIARLRGALGARDAEIERLREEILRLKERYLDL